MEKCCEVLITSLINEEELYLREYAAQVREGSEADRERRAGREDRELEDPKETSGCKGKRKTERS